MADTTSVTVKATADLLKRVDKLVKRTGVKRHAILLRLLNLGLEKAEGDWQALFSAAAMGEDATPGDGSIFEQAEAA